MSDKKNILIVDDSRLSRMMVRSFVNSHYPDWKLTECAAADEAIAGLGEGSFDLAIVDYNMPGKNGLELVEAIHQQSPATKVCLLTANTQDAVKEQAEAMGARFYGKPITEELILTILMMAS